MYSMAWNKVLFICCVFLWLLKYAYHIWSSRSAAPLNSFCSEMTMCNIRFLTTVKPLTKIPRGSGGEPTREFSKRQKLLVNPVKHIIKEMCWSNRRGEQMLLAIKASANPAEKPTVRPTGANFPVVGQKRPSKWIAEKSIARCPLSSSSEAAKNRELNLRREGKQAPCGHNYRDISEIAGCVHAGTADGRGLRMKG